MISVTCLHSTLYYYTHIFAAYRKNTQNRQNCTHMWAKSIRFLSDIRHWWLKINKESLISGSLRGNFWQPLIAPEAQKERSCQSFSASHIGTKADCPFHHPASFRPAYVLPSPILPIAWRRFQTITYTGIGNLMEARSEYYYNSLELFTCFWLLC